MAFTSEELLREFCRDKSEGAFQELVRRHLDLVYATALRVTNGDTHLAEDISQTVFSDLAAKASRLSSATIIAGWLYQHTWFTASKAIRMERRRMEREQQAMVMNETNTDEPGELDHSRLRSLLDSALNSLNAGDRDALVLRFLQERDLRRVGEILGVSEDAAQKRVSRALDKLRGILFARGLAISAAALLAFLSNELSAAPAGLAQKLGVAALTGAASTPWLAQFVAAAKFKTAIGTGLAVALAVPLIVQQKKISELRQDRDAIVHELSRLEGENARLKKSIISQAGIDHLNLQLGELQKLRGEVTLLRKQASARQQTTGKSSMEEQEPEPEKLNVMVEWRIAAFADEVLPRLQQNGFPLVPDKKEFTLILNEDDWENMLKLFESSEGVDFLTAPRLTTADRREARISVTDDLLVDGERIPMGQMLNVIPAILDEGASVRLDLTIAVNEFLRWEDDAQSIPRLRTRNVSQQAVLSSGQMIVMGRSHTGATDTSDPVPQLHVYCVRPTVINSRGVAVNAP